MIPFFSLGEGRSLREMSEIARRYLEANGSAAMGEVVSVLEGERVPPPALCEQEERIAQIERAILALEQSVRELTSELHALHARMIAQGKWMEERRE